MNYSTMIPEGRYSTQRGKDRERGEKGDLLTKTTDSIIRKKTSSRYKENAKTRLTFQENKGGKGFAKGSTGARGGKKKGRRIERKIACYLSRYHKIRGELPKEYLRSLVRPPTQNDGGSIFLHLLQGNSTVKPL